MLLSQSIGLFLMKMSEAPQGFGLLWTGEPLNSVCDCVPPSLEALQSVEVLSIIQSKVSAVQIAILHNLVFGIHN